MDITHIRVTTAISILAVIVLLIMAAIVYLPMFQSEKHIQDKVSSKENSEVETKNTEPNTDTNNNDPLSVEQEKQDIGGKFNFSNEEEKSINNNTTGTANTDIISVEAKKEEIKSKFDFTDDANDTSMTAIPGVPVVVEKTMSTDEEEKLKEEIKNKFSF